MSPGTLRRPLPPWVWVLVLAACAGLLVLRRPDAVANPQFWAEDGSFFFGEQYRLGVQAIWTPYAGYFHLLPRLIAWFGDTFAPLALVPALYAWAAVVFTLLALAVLLDARLPLAGRPLLALAVVLLPHLGSEVALTIANLQWITALALVATLCKVAPTPGRRGARAQVAVDAAVVVVAGLSGPFSVLFLPLFALRVALEWRSADAAARRHALLLLVLLAACAAIQAAAVMQRIHEIGRPAVFDWSALAQVLGSRAVGDLLLPRASAPPPAAVAALAWLVLLAVQAWLLRRRPALAVLLVGAQVLVLAGTLYRMMAFWPDMRVAPHSARYFHISHAITLWVLVDAACRARAARQYVGAAVAAAVLAAAVLASVKRGFTEPPREDLRWREFAERIGREPLSIPIHPGRWLIELPGPRPPAR